MMSSFGVDENLLGTLVRKGLERGGNWCDLYFEDTVYFDLLLRDGVVASGGTHEDFGCGVRVLCGEKTGYAYAESTDKRALLQAAEAASAIADGNCSGTLSIKKCKIAENNMGPLYRMARNWEETGAPELSDWLGKIESAIRARESSTLKVVAMLSWSNSNILMHNSLGETCCDSRPLVSISVNVVFKRGDRMESSYAAKSLRCGAEILDESLIEELAAKATAGVDLLFEAKRPKGGRMSVVMAAGASGILLHEAMGHAFEADFNRKGQSIFADKLGQQICRKGINIIDDGTIPGNRGACAWDDEGVRGQKTYMVTDGVLTSYLHDRISAASYGVEPTGNGRRESFRYNPIPRMRATYMESGCDGSLQDLIGSVRKGIYVDQFANGQVKIGEGDFTFYVKSGALIENGRLTMPVKDINIIGNGPQALADIQAVASDLIIDDSTWTCGKEQSVAVSCGIPSVLIGKLTVGGE